MAEKLKGMTILIQVFDRQRSLQFYCEGLGSKVLQSAGPADDVGWVLMELNGIGLMLHTLYEKPDRPPLPDTLRKDHHSDTALYFGCPDVEAFYRQLKEKGIKVSAPCVTGYGWKAVELNDPDGYHLCFQWPVQE